MNLCIKVHVLQVEKPMRSNERIQDSWLVLECRSGNKKAMELLVARWHKRFCKHAYHIARDKDAAKDIAQESWRVILKKIHRLRETEKFGSWALTIVHRKAIDWLRKRKKEQDVREDYGNTNYISHTDTTQDNSLSRLKAEIVKLPPKQKLVLDLFYLEGFMIREIAEIIGVSAGTVKSRLFSAREAIKQQLKYKDHEE